MADTEIIIPGIPSGLSVKVNVRNATTMAILELLTLSEDESTGCYKGDVVGELVGQFVFEILVSDVPVGTEIRSILNDAGPYVILSDLEHAGIEAAILQDTDDLQTTKGERVTATGFSTHSPANVREALPELDNLDAPISGISADSGTALFNSVLAVANVPVGKSEGFPEEMIVGDAYTVANGRPIKMYFKDAFNNTLTQFGEKVPSATDFNWSLRFLKMPIPTDVDPIPATAQVNGDETDWIDDDPEEPYLQIQLPASDLEDLVIDKGRLKQRYLWQLILFWGSDLESTHELTAVFNNEITVYRKFDPEAESP